MSQHLTPLEVVECLVAPIKDLGRIAACHDKSPYGWRNASQYRDAGDLPPRVNRRVLAHAARHQLPLTAEHLIWGAPWAEIEALLRAQGRPMPAHLRPAKAAGVAAE